MDTNREDCKYVLDQAQRENQILKVSRWVYYTEYGDYYFISNEKIKDGDKLLICVKEFKK